MVSRHPTTIILTNQDDLPRMLGHHPDLTHECLQKVLLRQHTRAPPATSQSSAASSSQAAPVTQQAKAGPAKAGPAKAGGQRGGKRFNGSVTAWLRKPEVTLHVEEGLFLSQEVAQVITSQGMRLRLGDGPADLHIVRHRPPLKPKPSVRQCHLGGMAMDWDCKDCQS